MKTMIFIIAWLSSTIVIAQPTTHLKYIRFLDIGITPDAHKDNTLTISSQQIDRKIKLERASSAPIWGPLDFDMDSVSERYLVTDSNTYIHVIKFLTSSKLLKPTIGGIKDPNLYYPTFKIIVNGTDFFYLQHEDVIDFFDTLILFLKNAHCDSIAIESLKRCKFG